MKILMIGPFPPPVHGMSLANKMIYDGLKGENHCVICIDTKTSKRRKNVKSQGRFSLFKIITSFYSILKGIIKIVFNKRYDVIYITPSQNENGYLKYAPFMWAARFRKIPYFIHIHGGFFRNMYDSVKGWKKKTIDKSLNGLSGAIVLGPSLKYMFEGIIPDEKIFVCENGVEDYVFASDKEIKDKIEAYKNDDTIRTVYLSNLIESKGILDLLEAIKMLKSEGKKVHLDVAGAIEPIIRKKVFKYFSELGDSVTYHGIVKGNKKKEILLNNYFFCLPTYYPNEGQPISILEAMANGCIIVTTDHGGIKDIVNEEYGIFVEKQNPKSIAKAVNQNYSGKMIENSFSKAKSKYHVDEFVKRVENILMGISDNSHLEKSSKK